MRQAGLYLAIASTVFMLLPQVADAFNGRRGTTVNPVNNAVFEVVARGAASGATYWCGAADYARRVLGASWTTRIYIARGRGPSETTGRKTAVQFTLDPAAAGITATSPNVLLNALKTGDNMSVQSANLYCAQNPVRF